MDTKKLLLLLLFFQFAVIFSQSNCVYLTINKDKTDNIYLKFTSRCKEKVLLYQYDETTNTTFNNVYDIENITLLKQKMYKIKNITVEQNHNYPIDYEKVKSNFIILNPNESYSFTFPLLIFLEKDKSTYDKNQNYYLVDNKYKGKVAQFRVTYNAQFINEGIINFKNSISLYPHSIKSNYIKIVLQ
ncbi:hypothetical protein EG339_07430 [Chryseobacterium bernardetii]|uniref:Uncharacterized protein n=1 Tax=Chryseobacterium bernardetii TaxID=1241978 RepID=A0A3G6T9C9_9FLAO|nr:hypothetical protein [Chryseobacterium bernardetii]AZB24453.1 hypothetical protein EG339_07430 [Chryseobacterium bernardetii]